MLGSGIHAVQLVFLLLLVFVIAFAALARKLRTPYPIVLVIGGLLLGFVPGIPRIPLNPEAIFLVVLPPLLYSAAWVTSWREFRYNLVSICMLAFGLVAFTVFGVAEVAEWVFHGFDWRMGFVLGAVISTTDAIAATAIFKRLGLPKRIVDVLEGESLVNDASGLVALEFGLAMLVRGETPTAGEAMLRLSYLVIAGLAIGLLIGKVVEWFEYQIDDGPIEIAVSILVPYAAYLAAESVRASGVLAVVACGLYLSRKSAQFFSPQVRLQAWAVWDALTFVMNGAVFVLIGLQLPYVMSGIGDYSRTELLMYGVLFSAIVILLRLLWAFPGAKTAYWIRIHLLHQNEKMPAARSIFVVGWTGMRGVIALAAALSLPETLADGSPFPQRNLIVFLTFSVILVTLVLQGLTLPWVIRLLRLAGPVGPNCEEREARRIAARAALERLADERSKDRPEWAPIYDDLEQHYRHRLGALERGQSDEDNLTTKQYERAQELALQLLRAEREMAMQLRSQGRISDEVLRLIEHELDLRESQFLSAEEAG
jgi:CPA1 family monovalent cation:H+ antiporter